MPGASEPLLLPFQPAHAEAVRAVIRAVYDEYGFTWCDHPYFKDLYDVTGHYLDPGGIFSVLVADGRVIATVGATPYGNGTSELHRLYLLKEYRGRGLGRRLLDHALAWSRAVGRRRMIAWSDVRLTDAHRLYLAAGFQRTGERICDDPDQSREYGFIREEPA